MSGKDGCKGRLEAATISDILYLFDQGNLIFIREIRGILKSDVCDVATMRWHFDDMPYCSCKKAGHMLGFVNTIGKIMNVDIIP